MEKSSYKNDFTAPPLLWTVAHLDVCAVSKQCSRQSWHKTQECLIQARKGPVSNTYNATVTQPGVNCVKYW